MAAIAQLKAVLGLDSKAYKAGVRESVSATQSFQKTLAGLGRLMAGAFSVAAVISVTKKLVSFASEIQHTADNLGVTTDELQALNAIALKSGVSVEQVGKSLQKVKDAQGNLAAGGEDAKRFADSLNVLKINSNAFVSASPAEALTMIGKAMLEANNGAMEFSAMADILGDRTGPKLIAMLNELGQTDIEKTIQKMRDLGYVIDKEIVQKLEAASTKFDLMKLRATAAYATSIQATSDFLAGARGAYGRSGFWGDNRSLFGMREGFEAAMAGMQEPAQLTTPSRPGTGTAGYTHNEKKPADAHVAEWLREIARRTSAMKSENSRYNSKMATFREQITDANASGRDINRGSASYGAIFGGGRGGVAIADRQLRIQQEQRDINRDMRRELEKHTQILERIESAQEGGDVE